MRKYIFSVLIALLSLPVIAQQQQSQAKAVLDKTAEAFRKAGGLASLIKTSLPIHKRHKYNPEHTLYLSLRSSQNQQKLYYYSHVVPIC